ncbi:hypothetical protein V6N13_032869 [Hibiscus sabdariffa]|uniref:Uncharacterized protein n=1 Tax=Hibiscus sabdariffa TaxID=183260 RepID=A0ABR2FBY3_9ROSI
MEVHITSKQMVKPSSSNLHLLEPFQLSLLDQLASRYYTCSILFYAEPRADTSRFSGRLKRSLSDALAQFYPLAGRVKNNLFISDYDEGALYVEAEVKCRLSDFVGRAQELGALNQLLPCRPFCYVQDSNAPQLAFQVNVFDCGGIALALCGLHKMVDAATGFAFLKSWAAFNRGSSGEIPIPSMLGALSRLLPPIESMPENADLKSLFFGDGRRRVTRSFMFDANAIATLKLRAESKSLEHPSRVLALTAFLWKHAIRAGISVSGTPKPVFLCQPVSIRQRMRPQLPSYSIGNMFLPIFAKYNPAGQHIDQSELCVLLRQTAQSVPNNSQDVLQGFKTITEQVSQIAEMVSKGNANFYVLSSWLNTYEPNEDFGWGKPSLISIPEVDSNIPGLINWFFLKNTGAGRHNGIEVWITLSDKEMGFLEHDPEFLAFASPTPSFGKI